MMTAPTSNDLQAADLLALARLDDDGAPAPVTWRPVKRDRKQTRDGQAAQTTVPATTANGSAGTA